MHMRTHTHTLTHGAFSALPVDCNYLVRMRRRTASDVCVSQPQMRQAKAHVLTVGFFVFCCVSVGRSVGDGSWEETSC